MLTSIRHHHHHTARCQTVTTHTANVCKKFSHPCVMMYETLINVKGMMVKKSTGASCWCQIIRQYSLANNHTFYSIILSGNEFFRIYLLFVLDIDV